MARKSRPEPQNSGDSWVRLAATTIGVADGKGAATPITLSSAVDWQVGDHVVVTTTDYLANHSEEAVICGATGPTSFTVTTSLTYTSGACPAKTALKWTHYGKQYTLTGRLLARLGITKPAAETRAAVGLLTRSIRIVSEGDALRRTVPARSHSEASAQCIDDRLFFRRSHYRAAGVQVFSGSGRRIPAIGPGRPHRPLSRPFPHGEAGAAQHLSEGFLDQ